MANFLISSFLNIPSNDMRMAMLKVSVELHIFVSRLSDSLASASQIIWTCGDQLEHKLNMV
jgi:hypothetical protein